MYVLIIEELSNMTECDKPHHAL